MSAYFDRLCDAMEVLAEQDNVVFMGQAVEYPGTGMSRSFKNVPREKLRELPVFEDTQMGMATGVALAGGLPICIYPRFNFLLCATNQLVLHLDKLPLYSRRGYKPKVIIRTAIGSESPLYPGVQHIGDFTEALEAMLATVRVRRVKTSEEILPAYEAALRSPYSTIIVEYAERY